MYFLNLSVAIPLLSLSPSVTVCDVSSANVHVVRAEEPSQSVPMIFGTLYLQQTGGKCTLPFLASKNQDTKAAFLCGCFLPFKLGKFPPFPCLQHNLDKVGSRLRGHRLQIYPWEQPGTVRARCCSRRLVLPLARALQRQHGFCIKSNSETRVAVMHTFI